MQNRSTVHVGLLLECREGKHIDRCGRPTDFGNDHELTQGRIENV